MYDLICEDCGTTHPVRRSNAKVCPSCRLLRNLTWATGNYKRPRKCRACGKPFRPLRVRDLAHCGTCTARYEHQPGWGTCLFCKKETGLLRGVPVCVVCAKHPETQERVIKALIRGQGQRREANADALESLKHGAPALRRIRDNARARV